MLRNDRTGEIAYTPPQHMDDVIHLMGRLEAFINDDNTEKPIDPPIRMAPFHHQFESIHPSYGSNGRAGRTIDVSYLVLTGSLDISVLYPNYYLVQSKSEYYRLLQHVRGMDEWGDWLLYMLEAME